jgi:hypothetical protein
LELGDCLENIVGHEPSLEFAAMVADEMRRLLKVLNDSLLQRIAV